MSPSWFLQGVTGGNLKFISSFFENIVAAAAMPTPTHGRVTLQDFASLCKAPRGSLCWSNSTEFETLCDESSCEVLVMEDLFGRHLYPHMPAMCTPPCTKGCRPLSQGSTEQFQAGHPPLLPSHHWQGQMARNRFPGGECFFGELSLV